MESRRHAGPRPPPSRRRELVITRRWSYWVSTSRIEACAKPPAPGVSQTALARKKPLCQRHGLHNILVSSMCGSGAAGWETTKKSRTRQRIRDLEEHTTTWASSPSRCAPRQTADSAASAASRRHQAPAFYSSDRRVHPWYTGLRGNDIVRPFSSCGRVSGSVAGDPSARRASLAVHH